MLPPVLPRHLVGTTLLRLGKVCRPSILLVVLAYLITSAGIDAEAQTTRLKLLDQVPELGAGAVSEDPLSPGALVAVFTREARRAYALENLRTGHEDFGREIREGSAATFRLGRERRTPEEFEQTEASGNVYYVLALTTRGELLGSYVKDDSRGGDYYPGFARVVSGDMVMGPVPEEHRETLKGALRSTVDPEVTDTADGSRAVKDTAEASSSGEEEKQAESTETASDRDRGYLQALWATLHSWFDLILGLLIGGLWTWLIMYRKYTSKIAKKERRERELIREIKKESNDDLEEVKKEVKKSERVINKKNHKIKKLKNKLKQSKKYLRKNLSQKSEPSEPQADKADSHDEEVLWDRDVDTEVETVGKVFADWCRNTADLNARTIEDFAEQLELETPGAEVQRICREKYAGELVFTDSAREPVEYWLVRLGQRGLLLPKPQQSGFRELEKCFEAKNTSSDGSGPVLAAIAPEDVKHLLPATLVEEGGRGRTLGEKGCISLSNTSGNESSGNTGKAGGGTTGSVSRAKSTASTIGEVFVEWCHSEDTMIGRYYMFERTLSETLPDAEVSPIYRQTDTENGYAFDAGNTSEEFWLVEVNSGNWLLPAPQKRNRFPSLGRAFEKNEASPSALTEVMPARVTSKGAHYELQEPGRVQTDPSAQ